MDRGRDSAEAFITNPQLNPDVYSFNALHGPVTFRLCAHEARDVGQYVSTKIVGDTAQVRARAQAQAGVWSRCRAVMQVSGWGRRACGYCLGLR